MPPGKFFDALVRVPGWQTLPVTVAAQRVQISAYPDAYAKWVPDAAALLGQVGDVAPTDTCSTTPSASTGGGPIPAGFDHQGNPRTAEQAATWITGQVAHRTTRRTLSVRVNAGRTLPTALGSGYPTAVSHWRAPGPKGSGPAPRGALIFIDSTNVDEHVVFSLGDGMAVSTDFDGHRYAAGKLGIGTVAQISKAFGPVLGWRAPNFRVGSGN